VAFARLNIVLWPAAASRTVKRSLEVGVRASFLACGVAATGGVGPPVVGGSGPFLCRRKTQKNQKHREFKGRSRRRVRKSGRFARKSPFSDRETPPKSLFSGGRVQLVRL
jgi:hypothetical protein